MPAPTLRSWATPLTLGSFLLMAATGILMFFNVVPGYITDVHEWLSWAFLLGAGAHVWVNWRPFLRHLKTAYGRASVLLFATALALSPLSFGTITVPQLKLPIVEALVEARLSVLADLFHSPPAELVARLRRHGLDATPHRTILELAEESGLDEFHILGLIVLRE